MKPLPHRSLLFFILVLIANAQFAQTLFWSSEVNVATPTYGGIRPRIALTTGNFPLVMWGGGNTTQPLFTARWNGTSFLAPIQVTPPNVDPFIDTWAGATIGARGNTAFVTFKRQPEMMNYIFIVKSTDGGLTWSDTTRVDGMTGPYSRFPGVEVSPSGNPVVMFMSFNTSWANAEYVVSNSTDGGATFPMPVNVSGLGGSDVCDCCPAYMFIDNNRQIAAWRRNNNNLRDMWVGMSSDAGQTFTMGADVDNTNWMIAQCPSTGPDPNLYLDTVRTVYMSEGWGGDSRIYLSTLNVTNQGMGIMTALAGTYPSSVVQNYPQIAGNGDTLGVVWQQVDGTGNSDVYFSYSLTGAAGLVNNEMILNNVTMGTQRNPDITYSSGRFHFVWQDVMTGNVIYKYAAINGVGFEENFPESQLKTFPNPSNGNIFIQLEDGTDKIKEVTLTSIDGKEISGVISHSFGRTGILHQAPGIYLAHVITDKGEHFIKKIVFY